MFAASAFVVTAVLFAAAMVVASSLSIPDPAKRFLPPSARGLPSDQTPEGLELANDNRIGQARTLDEPMPEVTAVPEPPSAGNSEPSDAEGRAVSSSGDTSTNVTGSPAPFAQSRGRAQDAPPSTYTGPTWPSWGGPTTPAAPAGGREPRPSESESTEPEPTEPPPIDPATEVPPSESSTAEPPSSESEEPASSDSVGSSTQDGASKSPSASEDASE
jgi:hypothetical protein